MTLYILVTITANHIPRTCLSLTQTKPASRRISGLYTVIAHYVVLLSNHGVVQITHYRWRSCSLVMQRPLLLLLSMTYQLLLSLTYHCNWLSRVNFKSVREKH